jgi:hypothetical protein
MYTCPVCGFSGLEELPRSLTTGGSYEICPSCGFQFGVSDDDEARSYAEWREKWILNGMPWRSVAQPPPENWNPHDALRALLRGFSTE